MTHKDLRQKYITFFTTKPRSHVEIPSTSLVPENDPSTLFTSSGMQPLVPYLLGEKHPLGTRLVDSQKCFRAQDIEEVGDNRHTTFFEMLGNWSLGQYFKKEQLGWFFEFLTKEVGLAPERLYVTVFSGNDQISKDTESIDIWKDIFATVGIDAKEGERIFAYPVEKNWWSRSGVPSNMPAGEPGGPDSEVFYEFTAIKHDPSFGDVCHPNCDCGRFMEIGNSVFMQFKKRENGQFEELPQKNVDFGGGLERQLAASADNPDVFMTDLFAPIIREIETMTGKPYSNDEHKKAMRVIADHIKAATFLISDGVEPSNKMQGYVLRRLLRRSAVKMNALLGGFTPVPSFASISNAVVRIYDGIYFEYDHLAPKVAEVIEAEMNRFAKSLDTGLKILQQTKTVDGKIAFDLYATYGFPLEITREILEQNGHKIDQKQFDEEFQKHQDISRTAAKGMFRGGLADQTEATTKLHTATHLLQQALREVLGEHVRQKGSNITAERLRFDFAHSKKLTPEEIASVEQIVNREIKANLKVSKHEKTLPEALDAGALTVPGAKYPEKVTMYTMGHFSKEVCGGPHVDFTGRLGTFKIIKEEGAASQSRRIYATLT